MAHNTRTNPSNNNSKLPPPRSNNVFSDIRYFFLTRPEVKTLVKFNSQSEKQSYSFRILQRINTSVSDFSILNVHRIGIEVPVTFVFEELMKWNGDSTCWPNNLARVNRVDGRIDEIQLFLLGLRKYPFGFKKSFLGLHYIPFFNLNAIRIQQIPDPTDSDNARYLLYETYGGYPIGIFSMFVRSAIVEEEEKEMAQLFLGVGFDFYGKKDWSRSNLIYKVWAGIHNRATANIMNRFKHLCEWQFEKLTNG